MALHWIYTSKSIEDWILKATNMGGDSDSVGWIAG